MNAWPPFKVIAMTNTALSLESLRSYVSEVKSGRLNPNHMPEDFSLLCQAVILDDSESARTLLECGADINMVDISGYSPLMHAQTREWIEFLVNKGASIELHNPITGYTPLHEAAYFGKPDAIRALIEFGADMYSQCDVLHGQPQRSIAFSPPFTALKLAPPVLWSVFNAFQEKGYDFNGKDGDYTMLHACVFNANFPAAKWVIDNGYDAKFKDGNGMTALDYLDYLLTERKEWMFIGYDHSTQEIMRMLLEGNFSKDM